MTSWAACGDLDDDVSILRTSDLAVVSLVEGLRITLIMHDESEAQMDVR